MDGELFDSTLPFGAPELLKASTYRRYLDDLDARAGPGGPGTRLSQLSPSLQADLLRFEHDGSVSEALEIVAACIRHASRVTIYLQYDERVVPLTVFPEERLVHSPLTVPQLLADPLSLRVLHVEPATLRPLGDPERALVGERRHYHALAPLLWALALRGPRTTLLPEIAGPAVYRVAPGLTTAALPVPGVLKAAVERLRRQATSLSAIAAWPGFDRERAARLLNALYLQAGLIVSRSHPDAVRESWFRG